MIQVQGFCPMGCGETLMLGAEGYVTCGHLNCPTPTAVSDILADREIEHIVEFDEWTFMIQHPLRERLNGDLFKCQLHEYIKGWDGPAVGPGKYRALEPLADAGAVKPHDVKWKFELIKQDRCSAIMTICENCGGTGRVRQFGGRTYECWHCGGEGVQDLPSLQPFEVGKPAPRDADQGEIVEPKL